jgi:hypothetical protein
MAPLVDEQIIGSSRFASQPYYRWKFLQTREGSLDRRGALILVGRRCNTPDVTDPYTPSLLRIDSISDRGLSYLSPKHSVPETFVPETFSMGFAVCRKWAAGSCPRPFSFAYQDRDPPLSALLTGSPAPAKNENGVEITQVALVRPRDQNL